MNPFFITGFPRSRTAWLANLMTYGESFCWHDVLQHCGDDPVELSEYLSHFPDDRITHVGCSDSGIVRHHEAISHLLPNAPWVFIRRPLGDALQSFLSFFREHPYQGFPPMNELQAVGLFEQLDAALTRAIDLTPNNLRLVVDYEDLDKLSVCRAIWDHCATGEFSVARWHLLDQMRINIIPEKVDVSLLK